MGCVDRCVITGRHTVPHSPLCWFPPPVHVRGGKDMVEGYALLRPFACSPYS